MPRGQDNPEAGPEGGPTGATTTALPLGRDRAVALMQPIASFQARSPVASPEALRGVQSGVFTHHYTGFFPMSFSTVSEALEALKVAAAQGDQLAQAAADRTVAAATQAVVAVRVAHAAATSDRAVAFYQGLARVLVAFCVAAVAAGILCRMAVEGVATWLEQGSVATGAAEDTHLAESALFDRDCLVVEEGLPEQPTDLGGTSILELADSAEDLGALSRNALRTLCRTEGLSTGGSKAALLARLVAHRGLEAA